MFGNGFSSLEIFLPFFFVTSDNMFFSPKCICKALIKYRVKVLQ